jgi:serine/threonine-protein kinase
MRNVTRLVSVILVSAATAVASTACGGAGDESTNGEFASSEDEVVTCGKAGGGPNGGPADLFPCDSPWYKDVSKLPVAPQSSSIISGIGAWGSSGRFMIDFSIVYMHDNGTAPKVKFDVDWDDESDMMPVPIPKGGALEGESGYNCTDGGDCHLIVVDDANKRLFELYAASNNGGSDWTASQQTVWDLTKSYPVQGRGLGCTSADAAGLSVMAGLIGVRETKAGSINHALRFILPNNKIRKGPSFVAPATHGTRATTSSSGPPFGTRLRLKASYDESKIRSAGGKAVVRALKKYGMILADGGQIALTAEDDRLEKKKDPTMKWDGLLEAGDLKSIKPSDFEVVDFGTIQTVKSCKLL